MKSVLIGIAFWVAQSAVSAYAGSLGGSEWKPSQCGQKPVAPTVDDQSIDAFNRSVTAINDWHQQSKTYLECLIKEANADNKIIADSANREQDSYQKQAAAISAAADAAVKKFGK
jgi:hypothetical protein